MNKLSIYDLAFGYIKLFYKTADVPIAIKKKSIMDFYNLLDKGWTIEELRIHIKDFYHETKGSIIMNLENHFDRIKPKNINLLKPMNIYYHNELRITTPPPVVDFDYNTGEMTRTIENYFLEMRASYTTDNLTQYFTTKPGLVANETMTYNRIKGMLRWLTESYNIDLILYMIDVANDVIVTNNLNKLKMPSDIKEYYSEAKEIMQNKITETKISGGDKIVPRTRVLSS
jgi:hypothetical protein